VTEHPGDCAVCALGVTPDEDGHDYAPGVAAPDRPGDRDQQQAAEALGWTSADMRVVAMYDAHNRRRVKAVATALAAARREGEADLRGRITHALGVEKARELFAALDGDR
jgi:hypothetical protein